MDNFFIKVENISKFTKCKNRKIYIANKEGKSTISASHTHKECISENKYKRQNKNSISYDKNRKNPLIQDINKHMIQETSLQEIKDIKKILAPSKTYKELFQQPIKYTLSEKALENYLLLVDKNELSIEENLAIKFEDSIMFEKQIINELFYKETEEYLKGLFNVNKVYGFNVDLFCSYDPCREDKNIFDEDTSLLFINHFFRDEKKITLKETYYNRALYFWVFEDILIVNTSFY